MATNVLVVANLTASSQHLLDALKHRADRSPIRITLVMPAHGPGLGGREAVRERLDEAIAGMREAGLEADGAIGDADPMEAVAECFDPARHDEAIVCTLPGRSSKWLQYDFPHRVARYTGVPVTHVVADDLRPAPATSPAPTHEREPLGPLSVLAWGGRRSGS
ncbi:MAG TPA: hypothetical protein VNO82_03300 [Solirubrobacteraceae bacterium]|nr:hypothetical protein [Solirubrobacteraceae bacterium]